MTSRRIAIAMSGGVDSSVAGALLQEQGEQVFGVMLRLSAAHEALHNRCCTPQDIANARQVAASLGFPFYVIDAQQSFNTHVVEAFIDGYAQGVTPNPCVGCNRQVRWTFMLQQVLALGATHLATGHYARLEQCDDGIRLLRAVDAGKDQSYVLSALNQQQLQRTIFPLGELEKHVVRQHARRLGLAVSERPDSQDLCFVGGFGDYRAFLRASGRSLPPPGPIVTMEGAVIGSHSGLADYTIGQRKGIGIQAKTPYYVIRKELASNTLVVGPQAAHREGTLRVADLNWVSGTFPENPLVSVRLRYRSAEVAGHLEQQADGEVVVRLENNHTAITPGQLAVFYQGSRCLGGGIIQQ